VCVCVCVCLCVCVSKIQLNCTSNKVSNIIKRHIENRELLLTCILLLRLSLIFFRLIFYQYMVVFRFKTVIYVFLF